MYGESTYMDIQTSRNQDYRRETQLRFRSPFICSQLTTTDSRTLIPLLIALLLLGGCIDEVHNGLDDVKNTRQANRYREGQ